MTSGKLNLGKDLFFGIINDIKDKTISHSGDRRRTSSLNALNAASDGAYATNTLHTVVKFKGIVVHRREITAPRYANRLDLLQGYVATNLQGISEQSMNSEGNFSLYQVKPRVVYKVYIPELEPRPAPKNIKDPVLDTYPDVFLAAGFEETLAQLPIGCLVDVEFESLHDLGGPRIIGGDPNNFVLLDGFGDIQSDLKSQFSNNVPTYLGGEDGPSPLPGNPPSPGEDDPYITKMSQAAVDKKRQAESVVLELYNDPVNYCTVGIGHLVGFKPCHELEAEGKIPAEWLLGGVPADGKNNRAPSPTLTEFEAEALFAQDIAKREEKLVQMLHAANNVKVTQNQFDALMSAVFNAGASGVNKYIIKPYLAQTPPDYKGAAEAFTVFGQMGYRRPGEERYLAGLNRLREKERELFYKV